MDVRLGAGGYAYLCDGIAPASPILSDGRLSFTPGISQINAQGSRFYLQFLVSTILPNIWVTDRLWNMITAQVHLIFILPIMKTLSLVRSEQSTKHFPSISLSPTYGIILSTFGCRPCVSCKLGRRSVPPIPVHSPEASMVAGEKLDGYMGLGVACLSGIVDCYVRPLASRLGAGQNWDRCALSVAFQSVHLPKKQAGGGPHSCQSGSAS